MILVALKHTRFLNTPPRHDAARPQPTGLADVGARRVSIGGTRAHAKWAAVVTAARELKSRRHDADPTGATAAALDAVAHPFSTGH
jgi:2-methylisocitrate lyase-like PEP mutase family enzyme